MIEFGKFDILHCSNYAGIQERMVYTHMVIIIKKIHNDLFIHVRLDYDVGCGAS